MNKAFIILLLIAAVLQIGDCVTTGLGGIEYEINSWIVWLWSYSFVYVVAAKTLLVLVVIVPWIAWRYEQERVLYLLFLALGNVYMLMICLWNTYCLYTLKV